MLPILMALGAVSGLVAFAMKRTLDTGRDERRERSRLAALVAKPIGTLTLDEAEDGKVLARRYGASRQASDRFASVVTELRKRRARV